MKGYIYKFQNNINNKIYIGQTRRSLRTRYSQHLNASKKDKKYPLHWAITKYGIENFTFSVVEEIESDNIEHLIDSLNKLEIDYIQAFNSMVPNGYNVRTGGNCYIIKPYSRSKFTTPINSMAYIPNNHDLKPDTLYIYLWLQLFIENGFSTVPISQLVKYSNMNHKTISKHLNILQQNKLIRMSKNNNQTEYYMDIDFTGTPVSIELLSKSDLANSEKPYLIAICPYMHLNSNGLVITYQNKELAKLINMSESTISRCNHSLQEKNYLEITKNEKKFQLRELDQLFIWKFKEQDEKLQDHDDQLQKHKEKIRMLEDRIAQLEKQTNSKPELNITL